jgi:hypothetical protein
VYDEVCSNISKIKKTLWKENQSYYEGCKEIDIPVYGINEKG